MALLVIASVAGFIIFFPPDPHIVCHKQLDGALQQWMLDTHQSNSYPNIEGISSKSLKTLESYWGPNPEKYLQDYVYVPGLKPDDPTNLVMFYVRMSSHRRWHGDFPTIFGAKKWILIPPRFAVGDGEIELNEWVKTTELKDRLQKTIEFLKSNNRPNWQNAVSEQAKLMEVIRD